MQFHVYKDCVEFDISSNRGGICGEVSTEFLEKFKELIKGDDGEINFKNFKIIKLGDMITASAYDHIETRNINDIQIIDMK